MTGGIWGLVLYITRYRNTDDDDDGREIEAPEGSHCESSPPAVVVIWPMSSKAGLSIRVFFLLPRVPTKRPPHYLSVTRSLSLLSLSFLSPLSPLSPVRNGNEGLLLLFQRPKATTPKGLLQWNTLQIQSR